MAVLTLGEYKKKKKQEEEQQQKVSNKKSSVMTLDEYKKQPGARLGRTDGSDIQYLPEESQKVIRLTEAKKKFDEKTNELDIATKRLDDIRTQNLKRAGVKTVQELLEEEKSERLPSYSFVKQGGSLSPYNSLNKKISENNAKYGQVNNNPEVLKEREKVNKIANDLVLAEYNYNVADVDNHKMSTMEKIFGTIPRAISDLGSAFSTDNIYIDENGKKIHLPTRDALLQQKASEDSSLPIKMLTDTIYNGTKILATEGLNLVSGGMGGTALYFNDMFNDSYKNAYNKTGDTGKAFANGLAQTGLEFITEKLLGGVSKQLTGGKASALENAISDKLYTKLGSKNLAKIAGSMGSEATEEFVQEFAGNAIDLLTLGSESGYKDIKDAVLNEEVLKDALYSGMVGGLSGGFISGINMSTGLDRTSQKVQLVEEFKTQLEESRKNVTDKNTIKALDTAIENVNKYLERPFTNLDNEEANNMLNNLIENPLNLNYNINNEEGIYDRRRNQTRIDDESNNVQSFKKDGPEKTRKYNQSEWENFESNAESRRTTPTQQQINFQNQIKNEFNKEVVYFDNSTSLYDAGASLKDLNKIYIPANYSNESQKFVTYHEILESEIAKNKQAKNKYINTAVYEILQDKNFESLKKEFLKDQPHIGDVSNNLIAKDIICDIYAEEKSGIEKGYDILLSDDTKQVINYNLQRFLVETSNKNIMGEQTGLNNIQQVEDDAPSLQELDSSSFSLPKTQETKVPTTKDLKNSTMDPIEISRLTKDDANTTPLLPKVNRNSKNATEESSFYENATEKSKFLSEESRELLKDEDSIKYYEGISNEESLNRAKELLDKNGASETYKWFQQDSKKATSTDIAEGWILLKQYQDVGDYDSMVEVAKKMREIGTNAGQTVQAFNIMSRLTPEGMVKYAQSELSEAFDNMSKNKTKEWIEKYRDDFDLKPSEVEFIINNMNEIQSMEDGYDKRVKLAEIQKLMTDKLPPEKGRGIKSWMRISMLFNPKTQVRNVMGNALIAPVNYFSDMFSSYADKIISKKTGVRTTGNINIKAILKGMKQGFAEATNDYKKGINTKDMEGNRFEIGEGKSFSEKTAIGKGLNRVDRLLNYVMDVGDRIFSQASFENSLENQMILNNTNQITQEMIDIARTESLQRTWNDNNEYTKFVLNVRRGLNKVGTKGYGLGDVLIPFAKTPANLTKAIVDYSPLGMISTINEGVKLKRSLTNRQYSYQQQHKFVQNLGKATAGTMLYVLGYALAKAGITTGESDDDKDVANFMKNTLGVSSYSMKIGDKTFTYDWAQPLAAPLSITANIVNKQKEEATLKDSILSSLDTAGNILLEQSFLESLNTALNNNKGIATGIEEAIMELPSRAIPTFMKQIADMTDGAQRQTFEYNKPSQTAINKIKAKIPGLSKTLAPSVDTMGREIQKYGGKNNIFNVFLNPANVNTENISEGAQEIYRLYKETGETDIMPRVAPYYINKKGEKITLDANQRTEYQKISGKIIEENVNKLLNASEYKKLSDSDKANVINNIVNYSYNIAQKELLDLDLSNTYKKAYEYSKIGNISDYYTFKNSIDNTNKDTKKNSIVNYLCNSELKNNQIAFLYGNYYSEQSKLNMILDMNIPIKEYIKADTKEVKGSYYAKTGKMVKDSKKKEYAKYVNTLNLSAAQKAILIKMKYNSFKTYDNKIVNYINKIDTSANEKKVMLKSIGFKNFDKDVINYINSQHISREEKEKKLKGLGFTIRDGRVYYK